MRLVKACLRPALLKIDSPLENTRTNRRADEICADEFPSDPFDGENGVEVEINTLTVFKMLVLILWRYLIA